VDRPLHQNLTDFTNNITTIRDNIAEALLATAEKGVIIPPGAGSSQLPALIRSINPEILPILPVPQDLTISGSFIAEGRAVSGNYVCDIFHSNNGVKGTLVETLQSGD